MEDKKEESGSVTNVITANKTVNGNRLLDIEIIKDIEKGLQIKLQSNFDWSYFANKDGGGVGFTLGKVRCFAPKSAAYSGVASRFYADNFWEYDSRPNLSILLAKELKTGVTFNFGFLPISEDKIQDWIRKLKQDIKILYIAYMKPINIKVDITTTTVEMEEHD